MTCCQVSDCCPLGYLLAHLSRRELKLLTVHACVRPSTLSNMNISETSRLITIKFYLKQYLGGGKVALGFGADQIRTLVSMATDSSHMFIMGKTASSRFLKYFFVGSFSYFKVMMTYIRAWMSLKFGRIRSQTTELAALERLKKNPLTYNG